MPADYLDALRRRNLLTWICALVTALIMNMALFIIMPTLQVHDDSCCSHLEMVPDVRITSAMPLHKEHIEQKKPLARTEKIPDAVKLPAPQLPEMRHVSVELPFRRDISFMPAMKGPASVPVEFGFEGPVRPRGIFSAEDLDAPVAVEVRVPPVYPLRARQRRIEGWVRVKLLVNTSGQIEHAEIVEAQPPGYFERSVLECVRQWKLTPPAVGGEPVKAWMVTRIRFRLE